MPFFLEPKYDGNINIVLPGGAPELTDDPKQPIPYGPWLFKKMTKYAEYRDLIERAAKKGLTFY